MLFLLDLYGSKDKLVLSLLQSNGIVLVNYHAFFGQPS